MAFSMGVSQIIFFISAVAGSIQFTVGNGECPNSGNGVFNPCDDSNNGGLCASAGAELNRTWCCRPGVPQCGSWGQTCTGSENLAGPGQVFCQSTGVDTTQRWCCNAEFETCIQGTNVFNLCSTSFANPYANTSVEDALSIKSSFLATATAATSSSTSTSLQAISTSDSWSSSTATSTPTRTPSQSQSTTSLPESTGEVSSSSKDSSPSSQKSAPGLSTGAIAGIVISSIVLIALIAVASFFLGRKYMDRRTQHSMRLPEAQYPPKFGQNGQYGQEREVKPASTAIARTRGVPELDGVRAQELDGGGKRAFELP